ncbi:bZIP transcription factor [Ceratocystis platani]|uniref:BZIP transcription factor n=1 Tax=Ceratocystis fimbriata f. sp. platani TaxID=88771 RepID=A0A0F8B096_CERFI|nr:bZIP transcription factor [Ceratocystis platani]
MTTTVALVLASLSKDSSTNSSPVVALELNFDVNALGGANESHWPADALQACEFSSADILNSLDNSVRSSASSSVSPPPCDSPPTGASGIIIRNASPVAASKSSRKRGRTSANLDDEDNEDEAAVVRRQKNTLAARKYRQKRLDRIKELEDALAEVTGDRDDLRIRLARQEAETKALKALMAQLAPAASAITTARSVTAKED